MSAEVTTTRNVSLEAVLTALLRAACSNDCTPEDAPASITRSKEVCTCAPRGLLFGEEDGVVTISMTRDALAGLRESMQLEAEAFVANPSQHYQFKFDGTYHKVSIDKSSLCRMVEEIWKASTGFSITVDTIFVDKIVTAIDLAAV